MLENLLKVIQIDTTQAVKSVKDYENEVNSATKATSNLDSSINDLKDTADSGILNGITAGFNEAVDATLGEIGKIDAEVAGLGYKVKDFMKIFSAFTSTALKGMNALKLAIAGTGIGLLVVAAATLYARWEEVRNSIGLSDETIQNFKNTAVNVLKTVMGYTVALGSAIGTYIIGSIKSVKEQYSNLFNAITSFFKGEFDQSKKYINQIWVTHKNVLNNAKEQWTKGMQAGADVIDALFSSTETKVETHTTKVKEQVKDLIEEYKKDRLEAIQYAEKLDSDYAKNSIATEEQRQAALNEIHKQSLESQIALYDQILGMEELTAEKRVEIEKERQEAIDQLNLQAYTEANARIEEQKAKEQEEFEHKLEEEQYKAELKQSQLDAEVLAEEEKEQKLYEIKQASYERQLALLDEYIANFDGSEEQLFKLQQKRNRLKDKMDVEQAKNTKKQSDNELKYRKLTMNESLRLTSSTLGSLRKLAGENSTAGKALAIAQTTIDTYQSATAAYKAMAGIPIVGPGLGAAAAAAAIISGIANVKEIMSVDEQGESAGPTDNSSSIQSISAPVQAMPNVAVSPLLDESRDLLQRQNIPIVDESATRVYVVESDIQEVGNRVNVRESEATF